MSSETDRDTAWEVLDCEEFEEFLAQEFYSQPGKLIGTATRDRPFTVPAGGRYVVNSYCENQGQACQVRHWTMELKTYDGPVILRPERLRCPCCGKHSARWAEVSEPEKTLAWNRATGEISIEGAWYTLHPVSKT